VSTIEICSPPTPTTTKVIPDEDFTITQTLAQMRLKTKEQSLGAIVSTIPAVVNVIAAPTTTVAIPTAIITEATC
ncbi:hypothetical protein Tco_0510310, partial [Tanacetum coccineum]